MYSALTPKKARFEDSVKETSILGCCWLSENLNNRYQYIDFQVFNVENDTLYLWGLDLSGTEQGAGGVGGLLAVTDEVAGSTSYVLSDGNGNVTGYVDASSGSLVYSCEYSPFGKVLVETGTSVSDYGFSTKPLDAETGLNYYNYRYYSADLGRWLNRDPIAEKGGLNLYGFVGNGPVGGIDYLGMFKPEVHIEIVYDVLASKIQSQYLIKLMVSTADVDIYGFVDEKLHYDNNTFNEADANIENIYSNTIPAFDSYAPYDDDAVGSVLEWFGQILHARQDYWSHTNAIEEELRNTGTPLMSGVFTWSQFFAWDYQSQAYWYKYNDYRVNGVDHEFLNKDNSSSYEGSIEVDGKTLYAHAYEKAVQETITQLERFKISAPNAWCKIKK